MKRTWIIYGIEHYQCTLCKLYKTSEEFNKNKLVSTGLHSHCKDCIRKLMRRYYEKRVGHPVREKKQKPEKTSSVSVLERQERLNRIREDIEKGIRDVDLARKYGFSRQRANALRKQLGYASTRKRGRPCKE